MIKNPFLLPGLVLSTVLSAQITITSSDMPNAGDSILISVTNTVGTANPSLTGANYTWNYSTLTPNAQQYDKFDSPLTFTAPFNVLFNPINTSYGKNNYQYSSIPLPGATITAAYDFFKETSSQYKQIGSGYTINHVPLPFMFSADDIVYRFPMNFQNQDSCDYKYGLTIPNIGYYGQTGHRVNVVDGWGALTTPFGTFQTLRIKSTIAAVDTVYNDSLQAGSNIPRALKYEFKWFAAGKKVPVLEIDAHKVLGSIVVNNVMYTDSSRAGVPQVGIAENTTAGLLNINIYPNPCVNEITLSYRLAKTGPVKISITDIVGKKTAVITDEPQAAGTHQKSIGTANLHLTPGIYFLRFQTNNFKETRKIVVAN